MAHNPYAIVEYHPLRQTTSVERTGEQLSEAIRRGNLANNLMTCWKPFKNL